MATRHLLFHFENAARQLSQEQLNAKQVLAATGVVLNSVYLKLYKKSWATPLHDPLTAESRIFFSVWVNDATASEQKIFYNIHALKMRLLKGYRIQSRKFADLFRSHFKKFEKNWPNVSTNFGPLTLMEGWIKLDTATIENDIVRLANNFLTIEHLVDNTLATFK